MNTNQSPQKKAAGKYIVLASDLGIGNRNVSHLPCQMLFDYLTGYLGDGIINNDENKNNNNKNNNNNVTQVLRLIIAGNALSPQDIRNTMDEYNNADENDDFDEEQEINENGLSATFAETQVTLQTMGNNKSPNKTKNLKSLFNVDTSIEETKKLQKNNTFYNDLDTITAVNKMNKNESEKENQIKKDKIHQSEALQSSLHQLDSLFAGLACNLTVDVMPGVCVYVRMCAVVYGV